MPAAHTNIYPILAALSVALASTAWMTALAWTRRKEQNMVLFSALSFLGFLWTLVDLLYNVADAPLTRHVAMDLRYLPIVSIPLVWLLFSTAVSGHSALSIRQGAALAAVPVMSIFLLATNESHGWFFSGIHSEKSLSGEVMGHTFGPWFWIHTVYSYAVFGAGILIMAGMLRRAHRRLRPRVALMLTGALVPALLSVAYLVDEAAFGYFDPSPVGFAISTACYGYCVFRWRALDLTPVPPSRLLSSMSEARVIYTREGRVLDLNENAEALLKEPSEALIGEVPTGFLADLWAQRSQEGSFREVYLDACNWPGHYEVALTPIAEAGAGFFEKPTHWHLRLRNVSTRRDREVQLRTRAESCASEVQALRTRLQDLERDLIPRLSGIQGLAESLAAEQDGEAGEFARLIRDNAARLSSLLHVVTDDARSDDSGQSRRPSRAPVRRSDVDPHGTYRSGKGQPL